MKRSGIALADEVIRESAFLSARRGFGPGAIGGRESAERPSVMHAE
jgi:hypothetical protein